MFDHLNRLESEGILSCQMHSTGQLVIWNYTSKCQYTRHWNETTMAARGLILDNDQNIVNRGFLKFFNYGECPDGPDDKMPDLPFKVLDKIDGSLGILYFVDGLPFIATRGSFDGEQAVKGTSIFREKYVGYEPPKGFTAVFEIVYPEDRKVINYKNLEDLIHLGLVDNATGLVRYDLDPNWPGPRVQEFPQLPPEELVNFVRPNAEGYVVRWQNGFQLKVKLEEYLRVHRAMFLTSTRSIWEALSGGKKLSDLLEEIPDEVHPFVKEQGEKLLQRHADVLSESLAMFIRLSHLKDNRKAFAEKATMWAYPAILFAMLDGKDCKKIIWKLIEPEWKPAKSLPDEYVA